MPHLALPTLTSYLRPRGIDVIQRDLNVETFDTILSRDHIEQSLARLRDRTAAGKRRPARHAPPRDKLEWALQEGPRLAARVEQAKSDLRSDAFLDGPRGVQAFLDIGACQEIASLPFFPSSLDLLGLVPPAPVDNSRLLFQAARDPQRNLFVEIFQGGIVADVLRTQPDILGISIPTMGQMLAGVTLASLVKQAGYSGHITVGGPHITMLREVLPQVPALFDLIDSAVLFDGEEPLFQLAEALDGRGDLSRISNLIYHDEHGVHVSEHAKPGASLEPRLPDFDGLPLDRYFAPRLVLPLLTSHSCYHGKCAFCGVGYGEPAAFRPLASELIADQVQALQAKYGVRHIFFADEAISPRHLRDLPAAFEKLATPVHWCGCARFEQALSQEIIDKMARGGCRMLLYGLETASAPIMQRMLKGTDVEAMARILDQGASAGIWNHVFFFFGFPGETLDHAQETVNFLYAHQDSVHSASAGTFALERHAPVYRFPEKYGVKRIVADPDRDLAIHFDYDVETGMDEEMAARAISGFLNVLPVKRYGHFYANDTYRFLYASYQSEQAKSFPPWLVPET